MARLSLTRRKAWAVNMALMIGSFLFCLTSLEAAARLWERGQANGPYAWELVASRRIRQDRIETPHGSYTLMHPGETYSWRGIPVQISSEGLRGPEAVPGKSPGTYRILNLGDSVVFGWGVRYEDTYGHQLQDCLNHRHGGDERTYEVINAGVPGWNMANMLAYLKAKGVAYEPDLLVVNFTVVNDVYGKSATETPREPVLEWLRDHTYFWPFLSVQYRLLEVRLGRRDAIPVLNPPSEATSYFPLQEQDAQWDVVWEPIREMAALAQEYGSEFLLIVLPTAFQVQDPAYPRTAQQVLVGRGQDEGIVVVDLLPTFQKACREAPIGESCGPESRYLWADMWMHPSALGHRLVAERILDVLEQEGWH